MKYNAIMICNKVGKILFSLILILLEAGQVDALNVPFQSNPRIAEMGLIAEPLNTQELIILLLLASGTDNEEIPANTERLGALIAELPVYIQERKGDVPTGEAVLIYLHEKVLKNYRLDQTRLDVLLDTGSYNCVSSAALYLLLSRSINLETFGIHSVDHVFCAVKPSGSSVAIDVETTNIWGYNPGEKKDFESEFTSSTGYVYVPPGDYSNRIKLEDKDMAGLILQNRIVELQKKNRYIEALSLAADRLSLTGSRQAEKDYFDSVQNLAAWYNNLHQYEEGILVINTAEKGSFELPSFLKETRYQLVYNLCGSILNRGDTDLAEKLLLEYQQLLPENVFQELSFLIEEKRLDQLIKEGYSESTVNEIEASFSMGLITEKRAAEMITYLLAKEAERLSLNGGYLEGLLFLRDAMTGFHMGADLSHLISVYEQNYAVSIHNTAIPFLNSRDYEKAKALIREGLSYIPDNPILQKDLANLESRE